jgi:shikimate 5-dehydrogenase
MQFVGVTTGGSSIQKLFPAWAGLLGLEGAVLVGRDLPLDAGRVAYRAVVEEIRDDPTIAGALVTTHKVGIFGAAADLFDEIDEHARVHEEISCISKRDGRLIGSAKDPITAKESLEQIVPSDYFRLTGAHVLCLGLGGAGVAIASALLRREDAPRRFVAVALDDGRIRSLERALSRAGIGDRGVEYVVNADAAHNDALVATLPTGSLVINATGMGKDRSGSPVTDEVSHPELGVAWDLNYRGPLSFLWQAESQAAARRLRVHDGWRYFLNGWTACIADVYELELADRFAAMCAIAEEHR